MALILTTSIVVFYALAAVWIAPILAFSTVAFREDEAQYSLDLQHSSEIRSFVPIASFDVADRPGFSTAIQTDPSRSSIPSNSRIKPSKDIVDVTQGSKPEHIHDLKRRQRPEVSWDAALCRGGQLLSLLQNQQYTPTSYPSYSALQQFAYQVIGPEAQGPGFFSGQLDNAYSALGLPKSAEWQAWQAMTTSESANRGIEGSATFKMTFEPRGSAITFINVYSPEIPQPNALTRLSDISYLGWNNYWRGSGLASANLKYVFSHAISNPSTLKIIDQAWQDAGQAPAEWPGKTFAMNSDAGKALLGSPNGIAAAWLLINHPSSFRGKTVTGVTVFRTPIGADCMMVSIG